jgi:cell division protein FtsN
LAEAKLKCKGDFFMAVERYGSKTDVVVKLVLVFFIALLSFSIGTFVGKKFSDNQHKIAELEGDMPPIATDDQEDSHEERGIASVHPTNDIKPDKALSDEEIAKLAEEFVSDEAKIEAPGKMHDQVEDSHTQAKAEHEETKHEAPAENKHEEKTTQHDAPVAHHAPAAVAHREVAAAELAHGSKEPSKPAHRMAEGHSPVVANPAKKASRIPSSLPKEIASSAIGKFTVQVAAYTSEKEAQTMSASLKEKGFSAFYVAAKVKGTTYYRVSVGLFSTKNEANAYKKDLLARAKVSSAIVQKVTSAE